MWSWTQRTLPTNVALQAVNSAGEANERFDAVQFFVTQLDQCGLLLLEEGGQVGQVTLILLITLLNVR